MPPAHVKASKRNKRCGDLSDLRAVTRPDAVRSGQGRRSASGADDAPGAQSARQRTMAVNALRAIWQVGVVAPQGLRHVECLVAAIEENKAGLPELAQSILRLIGAAGRCR